jgi:hypothetical protein
MWFIGVQELSNPASKDAQNGSYCPENERCEGKFGVLRYTIFVLNISVV